MAQSDYGTIIPATKTGSQLATDLNNRAAAENSAHSGTSRPSYAGAGLLWVNTSFTPPHVMLYDGSNDIDLTLLFAARPGTVEETFETVLPTGYLWCDGAEVSRSTYSALMTAITRQVTGDTDETTTVAVDEDLRGLGYIGAVVEGSGIPSGAVITAVSASTITIDQAATATAADVTLRIFPLGAGNGSTTFTLPDRRGRAGIGRDDMGGSAASRLTTGGSGFDGTLLGRGGGAQSITLTTSQIPAHSHTASSSGSTSSSGAHVHSTSAPSSGHTHAYLYPNWTLTAVVTNVTGFGASVSWTNMLIHNGTASTFATGAISAEHSHVALSNGDHTHTLSLTTTVNSAGSGDAHSNVQPGIVANYIIKY